MKYSMRQLVEMPDEKFDSVVVNDLVDNWPDPICSATLIRLGEAKLEDYKEEDRDKIFD